jgi:hypothetical protein
MHCNVSETREQKPGEFAKKDPAMSHSMHSASDGSSKSIESMDVVVPLSAEDEESTMLHLSALECEVIAESETFNSRNKGLTRIRFSSYMGSGMLGTLALGWLISSGVTAIQYQSIFIQLIFVMIQALLMYLGYEFSRASVIHKLNHLDQNYVKQAAKRQADRNKKYGITLQGLMDAAGISLNDMDSAAAFARMTLSSPGESSRILEPIGEEEHHHMLAGYKRIYFALTCTITAGVLFTFLIGKK